jgi:hypothetical protein
VSPWYDLTFFILSPVLAFVLGGFVSGSQIAQRPLMLGGGYSDTLANFLIGTFIMAHLFIVFFRSHLNRSIFATHPWRFTVVPLVLFTAMNLSAWVAVSVAVLATWWDVYHSSLQTFGIGRIYDMKRGNDAYVGRRLDRWLNLYLYAGPILAGATLMNHVDDFESFRQVDAIFFSSIPALVESHTRYLTWAVLGTGIPFGLYYLYSYWRFARQGYVVSYQKVALLASTGVVSIYTWGFNTFGEAFFIMNFFHAWQYFAIVWWSEKRNLLHRLHLDHVAWGSAAMLLLFLLIAFGYGYCAETMDDRSAIFFNLVIVVAVMHFWYDGFIWSVRRKQV